ncbi:hypothetical protein CJF25_09510 [Photobacterium phosphoreum]|nr:hypothetical protein [Photobacterium phosphoreum]
MICFIYNSISENPACKRTIKSQNWFAKYWFKDTEKNNFSGDSVGNAWSLILKDMPPTMFDGLEKSK